MADVNQFEFFNQQGNSFYGVFGNDITSQVRQRSMDVDTDIERRNSSLGEPLLNGHVVDNDSIGSYHIRQDLGRVATADDMKEITVVSDSNLAKFNVSSYEYEVQNLEKAMTVLMESFSTKLDDFSRKISAMGDAGATASANISSNFSELFGKISEMKDLINTVNRNTSELVDIEGVSSQLRDLQTSIVNQVKSMDIYGVVSQELEKLAQQNIDTPTLEQTRKTVAAMINDINTIATVAPENFSTNYVNAIIDVTNNAVQVMRGLADTASQASESAADASEAAANAGEQLDFTTGDLERNMDQMGQFAASNREMLDLLRTEYERSFKSMQDSEKLVNDFFRKVGGHLSANVSKKVSEIVEELKKTNDPNELLSSEYASSVSSSMQSIIDIVNDLNRVELGDEGNIDAYLSTMKGIKDFVNSAIDEQGRSSTILKNIIGEYGINDEVIRDFINVLETSAQQLTDTADRTIQNLENNLSQVIAQANDNLSNKLIAANIEGTDEYARSSLDISGMFSQSAMRNVSASQGDLMNSLRSITASELALDNTNLPGIYRSTAGNFLKDRGKFKSDVTNAQRTNLVVSETLSTTLSQLEKFSKAGDMKNTALVQQNLSDSVIANANAHMQGLKNVNLHRGQYKLLSNDDKQSLDSFLKSSDNALQALRDAISAIEAIDPQSASLENLKKVNKELSESVEHIKDIRDDSFDIKDVFTTAMSGVKKAHGLFVGGMGLMGLGMLAPTLSNLKRILTGGFEAEKRSGQYRYELAKSDVTLGADINYAQNRYFVNDLSSEYFLLSQGNIGWDQVKAFNIDLKRGVGGHYGASPQEAQADMNKLTENLVGIKEMYGLSNNDVTSFMKTFYKDMGKTADEASYMLVSMARAAQAAGQPVSNYINSITNMTSSLREYGVTAEKAQSFIQDVVRPGSSIRMEEATQLLSDTAHAGRSMGFNDWGASGFYGMMAGQGTDLFGNIVSGMLPVLSNGQQNPEYYTMMTQRLFTEAGMLGGIGGGPGSTLGTSMFMDALAKRGYSQRSVSMLGDAYLHGDMSLFEKLLKEADQEKEDSEQGVKKAMQEAKDKIKASGDLMSEVSKAQVQVALTEKHLGEIIETDLKDPMTKLREGLGNLLGHFVTAVELLVKELKNFSASKTGESIKNFFSSLSPMGLGMTALAAGAGVYGTGKMLKWGAELGRYGITRNPAGLSTGAKVIKNLPGWGKLLGATALVGGAYGISKIPEVTQGATDIISFFTNIFTSGEMRTQVVKENQTSSQNADLQYAKEQAERERQASQTGDAAASSQAESTLQTEIDEEARKIEEEYNTERNKVMANNVDAMPQTTQSSTNQRTIDDVRREDFERIENERANQVNSDHDGMSMAATGAMLGVGGLAAGIWNRSRNAPVDPRGDLQQRRIDKSNALKNAHRSHIENLRNIRANTSTIANDYITGRNGIQLSNSAAWAEANRQTNAAIENERRRFSANRSSIDSQFGNVTNPSTSSRILSTLKSAGKTLRTNAIIGGAMSGISEYLDYQENPDKFTANERMARFAIDAVSSTTGMAIGAMGGPLGAMAGAYGGALLGDQIKKIFHISDEDGKKMGQDYADATKWASGKYTEDTKSLINSNDNAAKVAKDELAKHGIKMEDMTKKQQMYLDELFLALKQSGRYGDLEAAQMAAQDLSNYIPDIHNEAIKKWKGTNGVDDGYAVQNEVAKRKIEEFNNKAKEDRLSSDERKELSLWTDLRDYTEDVMSGTHKNAEAKAQMWRDWIDPAKGSRIDTAEAKSLNPMELEAIRKARENVTSWGKPDLTAITAHSVENLYYGNIASEGQEGGVFKKGVAVVESDLDVSDKGIDPGGKGVSGFQQKAEEKAEEIVKTDPRIAKGGHAVVDWENGYEITAPFGDNEGVHAGRGHSGIDIGNTQFGGNIYATSDLKSVSFVPESESGGYGNLIIGTMENGMQQYYGHADEFNSSIQEGQSVPAGTVLGTIGSTGRSTGPHVHFEVRDTEGNPIDPTEYAIYGMLPDGSIGDGRAPTFTMPPTNQNATDALGTSGTSTTTTNTDTYDAAASFKNAREMAKSMMDQMGKFNTNGVPDRFATGRLILDGTTAAFRDRNMFMTPQGVKDRLALSSGAQESSLYGFNTKGYFQYDPKTKEWVQYGNNGTDMLHKAEAEIMGQWGPDYKKMINFDDKLASLEDSDKIATAPEEFLKESVERYNKPIEEQAVEDIANDLDEKHSVNIAINSIGGGVTKSQMKEYVFHAIEILGNRSTDNTVDDKRIEDLNVRRLTGQAVYGH